MPSWSEVLEQYHDTKDNNWLSDQLKIQLSNISEHRGNRTVIFYASAFLQKQSNILSIAREDINGLMAMLYGMPTDKGLTLILHTPGGDPNAVESLVEYLHSKFDYIETIVPYLAMSGGAMISLASDFLLLGKQSQLGPIDPQLVVGGKTHSARAIQEGFNKAKEDIKNDIKLAHLWAPILQNMGPSLFLEAEKALSYSKGLVEKWLGKRMFKDAKDENERKKTIDIIAKYFNAENNQIHVHGQRIGIDELQKLNIKLESFEKYQELQNYILTAYHLMTLIFETSSSVKFFVNNKGMTWIKKQQSVLIPASQSTPKQQRQPSN